MSLALSGPEATSRTGGHGVSSPALKPSSELHVQVPSALDAVGHRMLADMIEGVLAPGGRRMTLDLGRGRGLDASLLRQLRALRTSIARLNCELTVSVSADEPRRLLQLTGLTTTPSAWERCSPDHAPPRDGAAMMSP